MSKLANGLPSVLTCGFLIVATVTWKSRYVFLAALILLNLAIVKALKKYTDVSRPMQSGRHCHSIGFGIFYGDDYGMPSGHVQIMTLITVFTGLSLWTAMKKNHRSRLRLGIVSLLLFIGTVFVAVNRVTQKCHAVNQVVVGALLGAVIAAGGFYVYKRRPKVLYHS